MEKKVFRSRISILLIVVFLPILIPLLPLPRLILQRLNLFVSLSV